MKVQVISSASEEAVRDSTGFVHVSKYGSVAPLAGELGSIGSVRFVVDDGDPLIANRRQEILATRWGNDPAAPELRAECVVMGHVSVFSGKSKAKPKCYFCGADL
jgi:hypothetical protein